MLVVNDQVPVTGSNSSGAILSRSRCPKISALPLRRVTKGDSSRASLRLPVRTQKAFCVTAFLVGVTINIPRLMMIAVSATFPSAIALLLSSLCSACKRRWGADRCPRLMGGAKLPTSSAVWRFITPSSAFGFHVLHARIEAEMVGAAKNFLAVNILGLDRRARKEAWRSGFSLVLRWREEKPG